VRGKQGEDHALAIQNAMRLILILSATVGLESIALTFCFFFAHTALRCLFCAAQSLPCCVLPFIPQLSGAPAFFLLIAAGELMLFGCYAPINSAIIWYCSHAQNDGVLLIEPVCMGVGRCRTASDLWPLL
jgi:hypothetical protein